MGLLTNMINQYYREKSKEDDRPMRNKLHPSTIGMCQRKIVFDMIMVPKKRTGDRLNRIFDNGHYMHDRYQTIFQKIGILVESERKLEKGDIGGHTDAVIRIFTLDHMQGKEMLVELKSASENSYKWMIKNNQPKLEHFYQLQFYMHLSQIKQGILLVENKNTQELWEHEITYDPKIGEKLEEKAMWCIDLAHNRKLPPIPKKHTPSYYKCKMCDYNFYCHANAFKRNGEKQYPIPFKFGSKAFFDTLNIIHAIQNEQPIPDTIKGETNGELTKEVEKNNETKSFESSQELVEQYTEKY